MTESKIIKKLKLLQKFHEDLDSRLDVAVSPTKNKTFKCENLDVDDLVNWVLDDKVIFRLFISVEQEVK